MNKKQEIPFCTHVNVMNLKKTDIEAIGIITYQASKINYDLISEIEGFGSDGKVEDKNYLSCKKVSRKDINIKDMMENNEYINNKYYQNFLLTSIENRKLLEEKIKTNSSKELKYE